MREKELALDSEFSCQLVSGACSELVRFHRDFWYTKALLNIFIPCARLSARYEEGKKRLNTEATSQLY